MALSFKNSEDVESYHKKMGFNEPFCVAPFTTLLLEPDGQVGACRHKGAEYPVGNILTQSFDEIWNSQFIQNWRQEFLNGTPRTCATEVKDQKCNLCPQYNKLISNIQTTAVQKKGPARIAFNFNGHCNLECNMCHIWQKPNGLYDKINFWNKLDEWIVDLEEVEMLSGEPFIQKDTYKLIDYLHVKKPNLDWTLTTNANWVLSDHIKSKLNLIRIKNIIISLDAATEDTYKKIRIKGKFNLAIKTLHDLQKYEQERIASGLTPLNIKINFLIQKENWHELGMTYEFEKFHSVNTFRTFLYVPSQLSLLNNSQAEKIKILDWYFKNLSLIDLKQSMRIIRPLLDSLDKINRTFYLNYFFEKMHGINDSI